MMFRYSLTLVALLSVGCESADPTAACVDYTNAWVSCLEDAYGEDTEGLELATSATANACDAYDGLSGAAASDAVDVLNCYTDEISALDCDDFSTVATDVSSSLVGCN